MALTDPQIIQCIRDVIAATDPAPFNFSKVDIRAAVAAVDQWATDNATSYNTALPAAFKNGASASQKAALLAYVALRRAGK